MKRLMHTNRYSMCLAYFLLAWAALPAVGLGQRSESRREGRAFGPPVATTVQQPTFGVSFDADGVLEMHTFTDPTGQLRAEQFAAAMAARRGELGDVSPERKVSLVRLEAAVARRLEAGQPIEDAMRHLAGLTRITSAFCLPEQGDIVIVGPAEPWVDDLGGVARGIESGRPVLRLDDWIVALRAYSPSAPAVGFVGCSINPSAEGLEKLTRLQQSIPGVIPNHRRDATAQRLAAASRESLGSASLAVFGISERTHFARVMIEADYRMKRMAIGVEPVPVPITTYARAIRTAGHGTLERWWLTPFYEGLAATPDRMAVQLTGQGVQLQTQIKQVTQAGAIVDTGGRPNPAATAYATSFTKRYDELAEVSAVFAQLRQLCDMLIVTAFMQRHGWYDAAGWTASAFHEEAVFQVETLPEPVSAPAVVNSFWKSNRLFVPVGGGVSIRPAEALDLREPAGESLEKARRVIQVPAEKERWWWD